MILGVRFRYSVDRPVFRDIFIGFRPARRVSGLST